MVRKMLYERLKPKTSGTHDCLMRTLRPGATHLVVAELLSKVVVFLEQGVKCDYVRVL